MNLSEAADFLQLLHGGLAGYAILLVVSPSGKRLHFRCPNPGKWPNVPRFVERNPVTVAHTVCTFREPRRLAALALEVPALWAEVDAPTTEPSALATWREAAVRELRDLHPAPSLIVDSGRGYHGYWLLAPRIRLDGPESARLAAMVVSCNATLRTLLGEAGLTGDVVSDLARVLRLPGSFNPKPGGGPCRLLLADGPRYRMEDLTAELRPFMLRFESAPSTPRPSRPSAPVEVAPPHPRRRGRPSLGVTRRDLRTLKPWARALVEGGTWRFGSRYARPDGRGVDRSRGDLAAVGAMVKARWTDAQIVAAFAREQWFIGTRFRALRDAESPERAQDYLRRTIAKARGMYA